MNAFDELKLFVYESSLSSEMIEEMINLMESCDEEDVQEVCESVEALVTEANAYNKLANKYKDEIDKNIEKANVYKRIARSAGRSESKSAKVALDKADKAQSDAYDHDINIDRYNKRGDYYTDRDGNKYLDEDRSYESKINKKLWMGNHGNNGKTPEEKYKAGRYLDAQKELNKIDKKYKR